MINRYYIQKHVFLLIFILLLLASCGGKHGANNGVANLFSASPSIKAAERDLERGDVMAAHDKLQRILPSDKEYILARSMLDDQVEPARQQLLHYYLDEAKKSERSKHWYAAWQHYKQALHMNPKSSSLETKTIMLDERVRQERFNALAKQRRIEDTALLAWKAQVPGGSLPKDDAVFVQARNYWLEYLEDYADDTYKAAKRALKDEQPEISYVYSESLLRLEDDSERGQDMLQAATTALPKHLRVPPMPNAKKTKKTKKQAKKRNHKARIAKVTPAEIDKAIQAEHWLEARKLATRYRKQGGNNASKLLEQIKSSAQAQAALDFNKGSVAFRQERLTTAIKHWQKAAILDPNQPSYSENLKRARQLQHNLDILQHSKKGTGYIR
ncbi:MAG: hypothetical protein R8K21_03680 [Mariprofundales bacterium]